MPRCGGAIVNHIASSDEHGLVNPLVLAEHVAWIEDRRDPFTADIRTTTDDIDALSTSPYHHIEERLVALRSGPPGMESHALLAMACSVAITVPWGLFEELHGGSDSRASRQAIASRLAEHRALLGLTGVEAIPDPLRSVTIDADLYDYLRRAPAAVDDLPDQLGRAGARLLLNWAERLECDCLLRGLNVPTSLRIGQMAPIAQHALDYIGDDALLKALARALTGKVPELPAVNGANGREATLALIWLVSGYRVPVSPEPVKSIETVGLRI